MARTRTIVGIGETLLCEFPDHVEPGGLAVLVARHAIRLGHTGVAVSRIGQDRASEDLLRGLATAGISAGHIQSDPDLPTGRLVIRDVGGRESHSLTPRAAFDNLQWDFDLVDVAQQTDAVVFGTLARRDGQSRSVIKQFLAECTAAIRVFDLTNRAEDRLDRVEIRSGFEFAEGAVIDRVAAKALAPGWNTPSVRDAAREICTEWDLSFLAITERTAAGETMAICSRDGDSTPSPPYPQLSHEAAVVGMLHGMLSGWDHVRCAEVASRIAQFAANHPEELMPSNVLA